MSRYLRTDLGVVGNINFELYGDLDVWLHNHEDAYRDLCNYYRCDYNDNVLQYPKYLSDVVKWIYSHKQLWKDFKLFFRDKYDYLIKE